MHRGIVGAALAGVMLLSAGTAFGDHLEVLGNGLPGPNAESERDQAAAARNQRSGRSLPYTTDGRRHVGRAKAEELFPAEKFSTLRDSRK